MQHLDDSALSVHSGPMLIKQIVGNYYSLQMLMFQYIYVLSVLIFSKADQERQAQRLEMALNYFQH